METTSENTKSPEPMDEKNIQTEVPTEELVEVVSPSSKKKVWIGVAVLAAVLLFAGAAFLGARLLATGKTQRGIASGPQVIMKQAGGGAAMQAGASLRVQNAPEIPQRAPDMSGAVTEVKNNSLMVSDVESVMVRMDESGKTDAEFDYRGTATEVVVTKETQIYFDTTFQNIDMREMPKDGGTIQQTIEPASLSEVGPQSMVSVWGYKRGDRLIAEVMLVHQMMAINKK